jgi:murein L,D-transpeptidase YcbB/YkuD
MHPEAIDQNAGFLARSLRALGRERLRTATAVLSSLLCLISAGAAYALSPIQEAMSRTIESLTPPPMLGGEGLTDIDLITDFYMRREFQPAWTTPAKVDEMMSLIAGSSGHGLIPEDYHWSRLQQLVAQYRATSNPEGALVVELDILLTDALARLGYHLRFGKVDPQTLDPHWNFSRELGSIEPVVRLQEAIDAASISGYGQDLIPQIPHYHHYRELLTKYREIERNGGWPEVPSGSTLDPGASDRRVPALRAYLVAAGYLPAESPDSGESYDPQLQAAVAEFQRLHGLQPDGRVGKTTLDAMNVPVAARIDQIRVNMERVRWVFRDLGDRFLIVNIAAGKVYLLDHGERVWTTRAIVGKTYRKTPIFKSDMSYLVLNPTWTVPPGILRNDVLPKIRKDPGYLAAHEMDVIDGSGQIVDPGTIDWQNVQRFPYQIRQRPGPDNALGRVKFMFPNPYAVYLHDTSAPELFGRAEHTFSSGCIRVENPMQLAEWVLKDSGQWDAATLASALDTGKTQTVLLPKPLTVMLLYWTVAFDDDWNPIFLRDVYQRDAAVLAALNAEFTFDYPR